MLKELGLSRLEKIRRQHIIENAATEQERINSTIGRTRISSFEVGRGKF